GVLVDNSAPFDTSFVSGESIPQIFQKGMMITSGSVCINKCQIISTHSFQISSLNKLYQKVEEIKKTKGKFSQISDKISHYLIGSVFLIAILHLAIYFSDDPVMAFQRALALLIVACPCALALGTPLTYAMGIQKAKAANILIKDQNVLDKALSIKNIFFDKTGTLTKGQLRLVETDVEIENKIKNIILNLEKRSNHPVAFGFRNAWAEMYHELNVVDLKEEVGIGVSGTIDGVVYQLRQNSLGDVIKIDFFADGISLCSFQFIDPLREDTEQVIKTLRAKYQNIYLISGDNPKNTETIARSVGLDLAHTFSQQSPEDKLSKITATKNAMMLGDGINDSLALRAADIGISVKGPVTMSLDAANVYFLKSGVASVIDLLSVAKKVRLCLIQNLSISLVYNVTAGALALMGFVNPLVAAILMPISSAALILNTLRVLR
ncbi:MAG: HAD-IC family P-type ATPase, partial [Bdellovibrionales bacterium]|nr:HAD-IC family P-type ATPase [Bdellovibrionales bacterium]